MQDLAKALLKRSRRFKRISMMIADSFVVIVSLWLSFTLRLGELYVPLEPVCALFFVTPLIALPVFYYFNFYNVIIRYLGSNMLWDVVKSVSLYSLLLATFVMLGAFGREYVPRSIVLINWFVVIALIVLLRSLARGFFSVFYSGDQNGAASKSKNIVIYGAGKSGLQLVSALEYSKEYNPVAFLDDNIYLRYQQVNGYKVYPYQELGVIKEKYNIKEVLLAMPFISNTRCSEIIKSLEPFGLKVRTLPGIVEIAQGRIKIDEMREVDIEDLLGREEVQPNKDLLNTNVLNKTVLVTGAGGSIGSELCRQLIKLKPATLILYERGEYELYQIDRELNKAMDNQYVELTDGFRLISVLGSVSDQGRFESICKKYKVNTIYHAAAYKHVPLVESNPSQAVENNILGTYNSARAAINAGVDTFVLVSTDKAVRPTNIMGATKRFSEMILQGISHSNLYNTRFTMVRFGNVLGSSGSVVPLFREQIKNGGPVTVTHPEINRYFMTIPEAALLVVQAGALGQGGDVFVLDMGEPVKVLDLAKSMIRLSGYEIKDKRNPNGEIAIDIIGLRPGEKLFEELLIGENVSKTMHPLIMRANEEVMVLAEIEAYINQLQELCKANRNSEISSVLMKCVAGYSPSLNAKNLN